MDEIYFTEYGNGIYALRTKRWMQRQTAGGAIMQSWVVTGSHAVMVIDSPVPENPAFRDRIETTFGLPVIMVNSHGHIDHIGCNAQFSEVYMAKEDWALACGGGIAPDPAGYQEGKLPYQLRPLMDRQTISLGNREILPIHLPGHTKGCYVFYDAMTKTLFGGDAVTRRVLYGMSDWTPLEIYLQHLGSLQALPIERVFSAHDDMELPADMPARMIANIREHIASTQEKWESPVDGRIFRRILLGETEEDVEFFDFVIPEDQYQKGEEE